MTVELLTEHCLEFLSLTGGCTGLSESTLVKMSNCWKSRAVAQIKVRRQVKCMVEMIARDGQTQHSEIMSDINFKVFLITSNDQGFH